MRIKRNYFAFLLLAMLPLGLLWSQNTPQNASSLGDPAPLNGRVGAVPIPTHGGNGHPSALRTANTVPTSITPSDNSIGISANATITVQFSAAVNPATANAATLTVRGEVSGTHAGSVAVQNGNTTAVFTPSAPFLPGELVTIHVTDGVKDGNGAGVLPWTSRFFVATLESEGFFGPSQAISIGALAFSVKAHDLNGDGLTDIAASIKDGFNSRVALLYAQPGNTFAAPVYISWELFNVNCGDSWSFDVGDLNGDGKADLVGVVLITGCTHVVVRLNDGSGGPNFLAPVRYSVPDRPDQVSMDDFDGDGDMDLVSSGGGIAGLGTAQVTVFLNQGNGTMNAGTQYPTSSHSFGLAHADIDHDGDDDILTANSFGNDFTVLTNDGYGVFALTASYAVGALPRDIVTPDLNGDGWADVVVANQGNPAGLTTLTRYLNLGNGTFGNRADYVANGLPVGLDMGDMDGDGDLDVVAANHYGGNHFPYQSVSTFGNESGGLHIADYAIAGFQPYDVAFGDYNGDGALDIAASAGNGTLSIIYNLAPNIVGDVILDIDNSCSVNMPGEDPAAGILVKAVSEGGAAYYSYTNPDGLYAFSVPTNHTYQVSLASRQGTEATCNYGVNNYFEKVVVPGTVAQRGDVILLKSLCGATLGGVFVVNPLCTLPACTHISGPRLVCPCEEFKYDVTIQNTGNSAMPTGSVIQVSLPPDVKLCSTTPISNSCSTSISYTGGTLRNDVACGSCSTPNIYGGVVTITLTGPIQGGNGCVVSLSLIAANVPPDCRDLVVHSDVTTWVGNQNCLEFVVENTNSMELCCSYDPNDKKVYPEAGLCNAPLDADDPLLYTIRFQNLGTAPAQVVEVRDFIDTDLDLESFRTVASSHTITSTRIVNGEVSWKFEGINLPDATADLAGSVGWVQYKISPKIGVDPGSIIDNTANIYFDANPAVITNTTLNQIEGNDALAADFNYIKDVDCNYNPDPRRYYFDYAGGLPNAQLQWTFGPDATPSTSNLGSLHVSFAGNGTKTATLQVTVDGCTRTKTVTFSENGAVTICHVAPVYSTQNPRLILRYNETTISVPVNAMQQHFSHGDYCGPCQNAKQASMEVAVTSDLRLELVPNPTQAGVEFRYATKVAQEVSLTVIDFLGREVAQVYQGYCDQPGSVKFDASTLPQGVYLVRLASGNETVTKKLVVAH